MTAVVALLCATVVACYAMWLRASVLRQARDERLRDAIRRVAVLERAGRERAGVDAKHGELASRVDRLDDRMNGLASRSR